MRTLLGEFQSLFFSTLNNRIARNQSLKKGTPKVRNTISPASLPLRWASLCRKYGAPGDAAEVAVRTLPANWAVAGLEICMATGSCAAEWYHGGCEVDGFWSKETWLEACETLLGHLAPSNRRQKCRSGWKGQTSNGTDVSNGEMDSE